VEAEKLKDFLIEKVADSEENELLEAKSSNKSCRVMMEGRSVTSLNILLSQAATVWPTEPEERP